MSDPLIDRLGRFTPDAGGLDRDAIFFAAGRASVRGQRRWKTVAALLTLTQTLTLTLLLAWPAARPTEASKAPDLTPWPTSREDPVSYEPRIPVLSRQRPLEEALVEGLPGGIDGYLPDPPPLTVRSVMQVLPMN